MYKVNLPSQFKGGAITGVFAPQPRQPIFKPSLPWMPKITPSKPVKENKSYMTNVKLADAPNLADKSLVVVVLDRSGSMSTIKQDMEGGLNEMIKGLSDDSVVSLYSFDDKYEVEFEYKSKDQAPKVEIIPRNWTALNDAMGYTITHVGSALAGLPANQRPKKVTVITVTDGGENASKEFSGARVKEMRAHQTDVYSWDFLFLGANQDALETAATYGIDSGKALTFAASSKGARGGTSAISGYMARSAKLSANEAVRCVSFSDEERDASV